MPPFVVETVDLTKSYRTGFWLNQTVTSLKRCSLSVSQGETFGLLGPNGAGKTTLLKILLGIVRPTSGGGTLLGRPLGDRAVRQFVGYLPENPYFYDSLTAWEFLSFIAGLFNLREPDRSRRIAELLDWVGIAQKTARRKPLRQYSKGMLQRVGMAQALVGNPEVVCLDEPMSGLDPLGRYQMREIILALKSQGKTIFFNSHILSDVELICDRVAILSQGELLCSGSPDELLGTGDRYRVYGHGGTAEVLQKWLPDLEFDEGDWQGTLQGELPDFLASLNLLGGKLLRLNSSRRSLEEFFVQQVGGNAKPVAMGGNRGEEGKRQEAIGKRQ
ncbi:MAG: ABC transporter ATP-binding protein [Phormidium sp. GEM2.Bin31]|nr:ABC transporter ATP-binding protein [Phormidium sp. BM_Day4_Bin.17]TVR06009.1 MAG: ABC transporter ATP-binding protein [Phormidium sp. GEM2.Bin31]UCJ13186.1 MAG: ABC transporter ATP-binding protein [Phormidium sp. PBR-2020]